MKYYTKQLYIDDQVPPVSFDIDMSEINAVMADSSNLYESEKAKIINDFFVRCLSEIDETAFEESEKRNQKIHDAYSEHCKRIEPYLSDVVKEKFINNTMHDCAILKSDFVGDDLIMDIDSSGGFCDVIKLMFINAKIIECDIDLNGAWWIHEEVYMQQDGYELHVLFHSKDCELGEMIITFDEIEIEKSEAEE